MHNLGYSSLQVRHVPIQTPSIILQNLKYDNKLISRDILLGGELIFIHFAVLKRISVSKIYCYSSSFSIANSY